MTTPRRVAILRCADLPSFVTWDIPDQEALFSDDALLIEEFRRAGVHASAVVWRDPAIDWDEFNLALIRSTWDYIDQREDFLAALERIHESRCTLLNPVDAVRWNSDKKYLFDLASWGIPTVPTYAASHGTTHLMDLVAKEGWSGAVLKPYVGAGGAQVERVARQGLLQRLERLSSQNQTEEFVVQPFVDAVMTEGEWSFIYVNGELSHTLLKRPAAGDYRAHGIYGGTVEPAQPRFDDRSAVDAIRKRLPFDLLYARLDLVRVRGQLSLLELELIEPMLYLESSPSAASRFVAGAMTRMKQT